MSSTSCPAFLRRTRGSPSCKGATRSGSTAVQCIFIIFIFAPRRFHVEVQFPIGSISAHPAHTAGSLTRSIVCAKTGSGPRRPEAAAAATKGREAAAATTLSPLAVPAPILLLTTVGADLVRGAHVTVATEGDDQRSATGRTCTEATRDTARANIVLQGLRAWSGGPARAATFLCGLSCEGARAIFFRGNTLLMKAEYETDLCLLRHHP